MLCHGFQRIRGPDSGPNVLSCEHGLSMSHLNPNVNELKGPVWSQVLDLIGKDGILVMLQMLLHCAVYVSCGPRNNVRQLTGTALI